MTLVDSRIEELLRDIGSRLRHCEREAKALSEKTEATEQRAQSNRQSMHAWSEPTGDLFRCGAGLHAHLLSRVDQVHDVELVLENDAILQRAGLDLDRLIEETAMEFGVLRQRGSATLHAGEITPCHILFGGQLDISVPLELVAHSVSFSFDAVVSVCAGRPLSGQICLLLARGARTCNADRLADGVRALIEREITRLLGARLPALRLNAPDIRIPGMETTWFAAAVGDCVRLWGFTPARGRQGVPARLKRLPSGVDGALLLAPAILTGLIQRELQSNGVALAWGPRFSSNYFDFGLRVQRSHEVRLGCTKHTLRVTVTTAVRSTLSPGARGTLVLSATELGPRHVDVDPNIPVLEQLAEWLLKILLDRLLPVFRIRRQFDVGSVRELAINLSDSRALITFRLP